MKKTVNSRYEDFVDAVQYNHEKYRNEIKGNGGFEYAGQVDKLIELSNKINYQLLAYLFGEQLGQHLAAKYVAKNRNLLTFFAGLDDQYRFFLLHELKTNDTLFAHC